MSSTVVIGNNFGFHAARFPSKPHSVPLPTIVLLLSLVFRFVPSSRFTAAIFFLLLAPPAPVRMLFV